MNINIFLIIIKQNIIYKFINYNLNQHEHLNIINISIK